MNECPYCGHYVSNYATLETEEDYPAPDRIIYYTYSRCPKCNRRFYTMETFDRTDIQTIAKDWMEED